MEGKHGVSGEKLFEFQHEVLMRLRFAPTYIQ